VKTYPDLVHFPTENGSNLLHEAIERNEVRLTELLLSHRPDMFHIANGQGKTPLMIAIEEHPDSEIVRLLETFLQLQSFSEKECKAFKPETFFKDLEGLNGKPFGLSFLYKALRQRIDLHVPPDALFEALRELAMDPMNKEKLSALTVKNYHEYFSSEYKNARNGISDALASVSENHDHKVSTKLLNEGLLRLMQVADDHFCTYNGGTSLSSMLIGSICFPSFERALQPSTLRSNLSHVTKEDFCGFVSHRQSQSSTVLATGTLSEKDRGVVEEAAAWVLNRLDPELRKFGVEKTKEDFAAFLSQACLSGRQ